MNLNKVFIVGNLTRDPELRQTPAGHAVASFSVATNRFFTDSSGQKQKQAEFHNVVAWGKQAEIVSQYLKKGSSILIEGRLQTRSWQDPQGNKRWKTEVVTERLQLGPRGFGQGRESEETANVGQNQNYPPEQTPVIELPEDEGEINVKDIPF